MPAIHMIGNAHLDPAWMWKMEEGLEAFLATCRSALERMEETKDFIFTCSSAAHYEFVERVDPALFQKIQQAVHNNRWAVVGGWWIEPDCHLPSGEGFIRQGLLGQRYFKEKFGKYCETGYCIDSFGHNANLPQLLSTCGLKHYVFMRPEQQEMQLEASLFRWQAKSGDEVVTYRIPLHYSNFAKSVKEKIQKLPNYSLYNGEHPWMIFYGVGNHGGGPTKEQIKQILKIRESESDVVFSSPDNFFAGVKANTLSMAEGEFQPHAVGCYAANSLIKKLNRAAEHLLVRAEKYAAISSLLTQTNSRTSEIKESWKKVCFNHFHDLLGGVSIPEATEEAVQYYHSALSEAKSIEREAIQRIACQINTKDSIENLILFNSNGVDTQQPFEFELWHPHASELGQVLYDVTLVDEAGREIPTQKIEPSGKIGEDRARFVAIDSFPQVGWKRYKIKRHHQTTAESDITFGVDFISNGTLRFTINQQGQSSRCITHPVARVFEDKSDTWGHGIAAYTKEVGQFGLDGWEILERGPLRARVRFTSHFGASQLEEDFIIYHSLGFIEQRVRLNWQEKHRVLKLTYSHGFSNAKALYEIPYGSLERKIGAEEYPAQTWVTASGRRKKENGSFGIVTDSKYSYNVTPEYVGVTIARSALMAHHMPPHVVREGETLRYLDQGEQEFKIFLTADIKASTPSQLCQISSILNEPLIAHVESAHDGGLPVNSSLIDCDAKNVQVTVIKKAEEGEEYILRLVERDGIATKASITSSLLNIQAVINCGPFEIKTLKVRAGEVQEVNGIEE